MNDYYDDDFIKRVMDFDKILDGDLYFQLSKIKNPEKKLDELMYLVPQLQVAVKILYVVIQSEMKQTNRMKTLIDNLPNTKEFEAVKQELEKQRKNSIETLLPIKKLSEALEESKNKRIDYIR